MTERAPRILVVGIFLSGGLSGGLELLCRAGAAQAGAAFLGALVAGAAVAAVRARARWIAGLCACAAGALPAAAPGLSADLLLGGLLGTGAAIAGLGLSREVASGLTPAALRWLFFPQVALIAGITELAYLHRLPYGLLDWPHADKVLHALLFGLAVLLLELWLPGRGPRPGGIWLPLSLLLALGVAALEEGVQLLSRVRTGSLGDLAADLVGMVIGVLLARRLLASWGRAGRASPLSPPTLRA
jgi:hypothetical protein